MGNLIQIIIYLGSIQGLLLSVFLFSIRTNKISNRLLGLLTFFWGVVLLVFALQDEGLYQKFPHLYLVFDQLILLFFPLLYLQVKYLLTRHSKFELLDLFHFLPFLAGVGMFAEFFLQSADEKIRLISESSGYFYFINILFNEVIALQGIVYSIFATRLIRKYQNKIKDYESSVEKGIIRVLYIGISLNLLSWILGIIDLHLGYFNIETGIDLFAYTYLILVLVIYVISYAALKSPEIFKLELDTGKIQGLGIRKLVGGVKVTNPINYKNNSTANIIEEVSTPDSNLDDLNRQLIGFMEEDKPYLNPELSLPALAQSLDIPRNQLSTVINQVHQKNFYEFVNQYRIDEVKKLMTNPSNKHLKLMSLAYDAGFNSKATFNRIFKQMTKLTPSEYISKQNGD